MNDDRYYIRHLVHERWFNYPWLAYRGADYPHGLLVGIRCTRRGALRLIEKDRKHRAREAAQPEPKTETELVTDGRP